MLPKRVPLMVGILGDVPKDRKRKGFLAYQVMNALSLSMVPLTLLRDNEIQSPKGVLFFP